MHVGVQCVHQRIHDRHQRRELHAVEGKKLSWLPDVTWLVLEPHLPKNPPGKPSVDDCRVISGILYSEDLGRWRDVPPHYGPARTIHNRYAVEASGFVSTVHMSSSSLCSWQSRKSGHTMAWMSPLGSVDSGDSQGPVSLDSRPPFGGRLGCSGPPDSSA
ncbi:hypothetical protein CHELA1G11_10311 [Hyphomicrobiales bacterium]|nr:hypothetical protein CHELA1G11_10311 [Hyphomicrobiales bacterium]CAH1675567.1 hypothetical protein CHELA1G2_13994 [Hyphomicrobiales bacterium]